MIAFLILNEYVNYFSVIKLQLFFIKITPYCFINLLKTLLDTFPILLIQIILLSFVHIFIILLPIPLTKFIQNKKITTIFS